jgi:hypothetical protein
MKAKLIMTILAMSMCLMACGVNESTNTEESPNTSENVQLEVESEYDEAAQSGDEESLPRELIQAELADYNAYLREVNCYGFLLSSYDDVRNVNLDEVFYSGAGISEQPGEEEIQAYLQAAGQDEVYTDIFYIPAAKIDELLLEKTGYSLQDMKDAGNELNMIYLEEYDAYFTEAGDTNYMPVECTYGTKNADGTVTLECQAGIESDDGDTTSYTIIHKCTVTLDENTKQFIKNTITDGYYAN